MHPGVQSRDVNTNDRARTNIRMMKALRNMSAQDIAEAGGFSSRQVVNDRLVGRTPMTLDDLDDIAHALTVDPRVLVGDPSGVMQWLETHPEADVPPKRRTRKASAPKPAPKPRRNRK